MKKIISMFLSMVLMITSLNTYCTAYGPDSSELDVNSIVNTDLIKEYGSYVDDDSKMNRFVDVVAKKNIELFNETAEKIAKGDIKLDKNISHNAELTEAFLKKIYDKDNVDYFKEALKGTLSDIKNARITELREKGLEGKELQNEEIRIGKLYDHFCGCDYLTLWYLKSPLLIGMVNTDIVTYLIHTDPESKEIVEKIDEIEMEVRTGIELYIDSMDLTEATKQSMKRTLNGVKVYYYGVKESFDRFFEHINREKLMEDINSDNETFFSSLPNYLPNYKCTKFIDEAVTSVIFEDELDIYQPNSTAVTVENCIIFYPSMFLCKDINSSNSNFNLEFAIRVLLSHEFGHVWNFNYIKKDRESEGVVCPRDNKQEFEKYLKEWHPAEEVCSEDIQKLETYAQSIVDEFNSVKTNLKDDEGKEIKIDGLRVYREAAADNFALNSVTALAEKDEDLSKIFFTFAKFNGGTYNIQDFKFDTYPSAPCRVNIGLKLCKNFDAKIMKDNILYCKQGRENI